MNTSPLRVLIAEDNVLIAEVTARDLETLGAVVVGRATDGLQAVELTCSLRPHVVLMDLQMPRMNGIEAARQIQARSPTPVVMLTLDDQRETVGQAAEAGVGAYLVKPASIGDLERAIAIARARFADLTELRRMNVELREALATVKTLRGLLPICSSCKKIRDDKGYWHEVEAYVRDHSSAEFTHSICAECMPKIYPPDAYPYLYPPDEPKDP